MFPRGTPDIGWGDLAAGLRAARWAGDARSASARLEAVWSTEGDALACLSVRSGFDLVLRALALPPGSEVLVSAVTIGDMPLLLREHGLVPVPVDVEPRALSVDPAALEAAVTPRTRVVLLAHLFGSRMPLDPLAEVARRHGLFLFEDCAQAFDGTGYRGHPESEVSLFSFGPIKTATALGGGLLRFRDPRLREQVGRLQDGYPEQSPAEYRRRLLRFAGLKLLTRPAVFGGFVRLCRKRGIDYDGRLAASVRGFAGADLLARLRRRPCAALLQVLHRRLGQDRKPTLAARVRYARLLAAAIPEIPLPGAAATHHCHWAFPFPSRDPAGLVAVLQHQGFDATRRASSLIAVSTGVDPAAEVPSAADLVSRTVYLPAWPSMPPAEISRLGKILTTFEAAQPGMG